MLEWKRRFALAAWVGLLALLGCSGGGSNQPTPSKASDTFSPASIAATVNAENLVCSADKWCWRNPLLQGGSAWSRVSSGTTNGLSGVWDSGESEVWAVGSTGTILHWDGSAWTSVSSGTTNYLLGVWGSGASDVWAVGGGGIILHWDGSTWTSGSSGTTNTLYGVWGIGGIDVWAVGTGTILHWDGSAWSRVSSGTTYNLYGVWGSGPSDVWAVGGSGIILHWDGSAWTRVSSGTASSLFGVWGSGESDVWAVGGSGTTLHWDSSAWTSVSSGTTNGLSGVWGSGQSDVWVWAVGSGGTILERGHVPNTGGTLQGTVTDTTGLPVAVAQVQAVGPVTRSTTTRGDGTYRLTWVPEGSYDVTATHADHNPGSATGIMLVEGQTATQDFLLTGAGILAGTITDSQGTPLAGVRVQLVGPVTRTINTGSDGSYLFRLPVGIYDMTATLYAYDPATATDEVVDAMTTTQNFTLNLSPTHSVSGSVSNLATGLPFVGATVRILNTPIPPTTTDANGMYLFASVLEGTYDMQASAPGFTTQTQTGVAVNQDVVVDFGLDSTSLCPRVPGNLVANCGFESGFQSWVLTGWSGLSVSQDNPHTGIWALAGEDSGFGSAIGQQLATTPGATYQLCYWLANTYLYEFWVFWDGVTIRDLHNPPAFPYTQTCHDVVASGGSTRLEFQFTGTYGSYSLWLDDVSVVAE
jgi:hypothetical protein